MHQCRIHDAFVEAVCIGASFCCQAVSIEVASIDLASIKAQPDEDDSALQHSDEGAANVNSESRLHRTIQMLGPRCAKTRPRRKLIIENLMLDTVAKVTMVHSC